MNLQFVKYFVVLAETKNFTKAAEKVFVVQSTFSSGIKKLEEHLNCKLFYRDKRTVSLTSEGKSLLAKAKELLKLWNDIEFEYNHPDSKELRIGLLNTIHHTDVVIPLLKSFQELHMQFQIHLVEEPQDVLIEKLGENELDVVFIQEAELDTTTFKSRFVYEEKLELVVPKDHPLAAKEQIDLSEINNLPFIKHNNCVLSTTVYQTLSDRNIKTIPVFSAQHSEVLLGLVASGIGVSLMAKPNNPSENVKFIPLADADFKRNIMLAWNKNNTTKVLSDFLYV